MQIAIGGISRVKIVTKDANGKVRVLTEACFTEKMRIRKLVDASYKLLLASVNVGYVEGEGVAADASKDDNLCLAYLCTSSRLTDSKLLSLHNHRLPLGILH